MINLAVFVSFASKYNWNDARYAITIDKNINIMLKFKMIIGVNT